MTAREIKPGVHAIASVHWERRLFDSLIPLPDGTSYNAYLVKGSAATALVDTTDPDLRNEVCLPYVSMHGSTKLMVHHLVDALVKRGVKVHAFELTVTDIGDLAMSLVDAATLIAATPTVHVGAHPAIYYASYIANMVRPKLKYAAVIGSYGWASKAVDQVAGQIPNLKVQILGTVMQKGLPTAETYAKLDELADAVAKAHADDPDVVKD